MFRFTGLWCFYVGQEETQCLKPARGDSYSPTCPSNPPFHFKSSLIFLPVAFHTPIYMGKHLHALRHSLWYTQMHICTHKYPVVPSLPPVVFLASVWVSSVWGHLTRTFLSYPLLLCSPSWNRLWADITISTNLFNCKLNIGQIFKHYNVFSLAYCALFTKGNVDGKGS